MTAYTRPMAPRVDLDAWAEEWQRSPSERVAAQLWTAMQDVVGAIVKRRRWLVDEDDLRGVCAIAFMTSLRSWRPGAGYSFRSWAALSMRGRANTECDAVRYQSQVRGLADAAIEPEIDALGAIVQHERKAVLVEVLDELRGRMTEKEWHVVEGKLLRGLTYRELADETGKTYQAMQQRADLVLPYVTRRLRERLVGVV